MPISVVTAPTTEPISIEDAKLHCRIDLDDDDALVADKIIAARVYVETIANRALLTQTLDWYMDDWPASMKLPRSPVQSVTSIKYTDVDGAETTFDASNYVTDLISEPARVVLKSGISWPSVALREANAIVVRFVAGWTAAANVPQTIRQAMLLLIGHWYENRETVIVGSITKQLEFAVESLLMNERIREF